MENIKRMKFKKNLKAFDDLNQSKWMRYEDDIIKYYYKQLREWLDNKMIKPSVTAFTSGLGRDIARLMEDSKKQGIQSKEKEILEEILNICNRGNARQNQLSKFFEIKRLCQERLLKLKELK